MAYLKYYQREREVYPEYYNTNYPTPKEVRKIVRKLCRHFKIQLWKVDFNTNGRGSAYPGNYISLPRKDIKLGLICHEIGHLVAWKKTGQSNHNKKTWNKMRQVYRYAKRYLK